MRRFFGNLVNNEIIINGEEYLHLTKVLRQKEGDKIIACIDDENDYYCTILKQYKNYCKCNIDKIEKNKSNPKKNITLFQMLSKKEYFDTIVAKSIELGVSNLEFFTSQYSSPMNIKKERLSNQVMTACKQCERSKLINANTPITFAQMLSKLKNYNLVLFAYEKSNEKFNFESLKDVDNIAIIIGAEGGFSENEKEEIAQKSVMLSLGTRILRCDTAVISLLTLVSYFSEN